MKRLARNLGAATSQAIDATNEAAVRVMMRQVSKDMGGLDAIVDVTGAGYEHLERLGRRELDRSGSGVFIIASSADAVVELLVAQPSG